MQFANFQIEPLAPHRLCAPGKVKEADIDLDQSSLPACDAVDGIVQFLTLKKTLTAVIYQRPVYERDRSNDVEPAKPRQRSGDVMAQGKGKIFPPFSALSFPFTLER